MINCIRHTSRRVFVLFIPNIQVRHAIWYFGIRRDAMGRLRNISTRIGTYLNRNKDISRKEYENTSKGTGEYLEKNIE